MIDNKFSKAYKSVYSLTYFIIFIRIIVNLSFTYTQKSTNVYIPLLSVHFCYLVILWTILPIFIIYGYFQDLLLNTERMRLYPLEKIEFYIYENLSIFLHPYFYFLLLINLIFFFPLFLSHFSIFLLLSFVTSNLFLISFVIFIFNLSVKFSNNKINESILPGIVKIIPFFLAVMNYQFIKIDNKVFLILFNQKINFVEIYDIYFRKILNDLLVNKFILEVLLLVFILIFMILSYFIFEQKKGNDSRKCKIFSVFKNKYYKKRLFFNNLISLEFKSTVYSSFLINIFLLSIIFSFYLYFSSATDLSYLVIESLLLFLLHKYSFNSISGNVSLPRYFLLPISFSKMVYTKFLLFVIFALIVIIPLEISAILINHYNIAVFNGISSFFYIFMFCIFGNYFSIFHPSGKDDNSQALLVALLIVIFPIIFYFAFLNQNIVFLVFILIIIMAILIFKYRIVFSNIETIVGKESENILNA